MENQSGELGGWVWLLMDVAMVVALGVVLVFAIMQWRKRRRGARPLDPAQEEHKARQLIGRRAFPGRPSLP